MSAPARESEVVWIDDWPSFLALEPEWEKLAHGQASPFVTHAVLRCWFEAFGRGRLRICTVRRGGRLVAALPLRRVRGSLLSWSNDASDAFVPLAETPEDHEALLDGLVRARWPLLVLRAVPAEDAAIARLVERLGVIGVVRREPFEDSPVIDTSGSREDYRATMSQNTRRRVGKHRRKLEREHEARFVVLDVPADPLARVDAALELEAAGWKGRGRSAVMDSRERLAFHRSVARSLAPRGEYVISELHVDGSLAAFDLAIVRGNRVWSLITSYDEALAAYSPGLLLRMAIVEACFDRGLEANDLLGDMMTWKTQFATGTRPTLILRVYRRRPLPLIRHRLRVSVWPHVRGTYNRVHNLRRRMRSPR